MKIAIDAQAPSPAYVQLYEQLRAAVVSGELAPGSRLPSKRLMAEEAGVSVITVEHAYALLADEGYIRPRERSGYYVASGEDTVLNPPRRQVEHSLAASNPLPPEDFPFSVYAGIVRRVLSERGSAILSRSPNRGTAELRQAIADYLARSRGISAPAERIIIGSGAEYLYGLVAQLFGPGKTVGLEEPCYDIIPRVYSVYGLKCESLRMGEDGIYRSELERSGADLWHVTPHNSYPSGITASAPVRHEYIRKAEQKGIYLVEDDYDSEFSSALRRLDTLYSLAPERVIYLNTFSKSVAGGIRAGYMILPEALLQRYREKLDFYTCTVPTFEQYVLAEFLNSGDFERHVNRLRRKQRKK